MGKEDAVVEAGEGFKKGRMDSRKELEERLELLDSARHSFTKILEKGRSSCEETMAQTSQRMGTFLKVAISLQFNFNLPNAGISSE